MLEDNLEQLQFGFLSLNCFLIFSLTPLGERATEDDPTEGGSQSPGVQTEVSPMTVDVQHVR